MWTEVMMVIDGQWLHINKAETWQTRKAASHHAIRGERIIPVRNAHNVDVGFALLSRTTVTFKNGAKYPRNYFESNESAR